MAFFRFGDTHQIRGFMSANRVGKTEGGGGYELTCHLTGRYPHWWEGARFTEYVRAWVAGDTRQTTRDIIQQKLLGNWAHFGTGLIPGEDILKWTPNPGVPEAVGTLHVQHYDDKGKKDGVSRLVFKSYDQGREAFQGTEQEVIWLDEEADEGVRGECILRLMTTDGVLMETFTPLKGLTPVVMTYLPNGYEDGMTEAVTDNRALVMAGWDDVPHLSDEQKRKMLAETPPHLIDARSKGIPSIGSGAVYPLAESEFLVNDMPIPAHWPRAYAMDVGWNRTAALWGAQDPESQVVYLYAEYYRGQAEPPIHATAIKAKGEWIPGVIDPASSGSGQRDGKKLAEMYGKGSHGLGLELSFANNDVDAGIQAVWTGLSTGSLKVFKSLQHWRTEYRMYHRNEKGAIVKENDHLMDCTRYLMLTGMKRAIVRPTGQQDTIAGYGVLDEVCGL
jgi:phage terminase large subunit-like protein